MKQVTKQVNKNSQLECLKFKPAERGWTVEIFFHPNNQTTHIQHKNAEEIERN